MMAQPGYQAVPLPEAKVSFINIESIVVVYVIMAAVFAGIIALYLFTVIRLYIISEKERQGKTILLSNKEIKSPFSFFNLIFIPDHIYDSEERKNIIIHETIHVSQHHSCDNLLIELTAALMWFNPLVWMMKKSLHLVHEYLADEGTLGAGIDKLKYQALLINQATEERLICLSSNFNASLIKKRMIMMTKIKPDKNGRSRIMSLLPLSAILLVSAMVLNGLFPERSKAGPVKINASGQPQALALVSQQDTLKIKEDKSRTVRIRQRKDRNEVIVTGNIIDTTKNTRVIRVEKSGSSPVKVIGYGNSGQSDSLIFIVDGVKVDKLNVDPGTIESVNVMKEDNLVVIRTKGFAVRHSGGNEETVIIGTPSSSASTGNQTDKVLITGRSFPDNVIVYINGKKSTKEDMDNLSPADIESIEVLKGDALAKEKEGEGTEGIIRIITKPGVKQ